jgi:DNA polymerase III subunit epsilon
MILFFDTETTGFFKDHLPVDDPSQPYLVQLAAQLCEDGGRVLVSFSLIVDPCLRTDDGPDIDVVIPESASKVHGITNEIAARFGVSAYDAITIFARLYKAADLICAHNIEFDKNIMEAAISRRYQTIRRLRKPMFCTMRAATPIINLPPTDRMKAAGFDKPKPPKLEECIRHFFNEELSVAHDAMADVVACRRIYFHLKSEGNLT